MGLRGFFGADRVVSEATGGVFSSVRPDWKFWPEPEPEPDCYDLAGTGTGTGTGLPS